VIDEIARNVMPRRYRTVSVAAVDSLSPADLVEHFTGREVYRHTRFVVARLGVDSRRCALVELARDGSDALFSDAAGARVLAVEEDCAFVRDSSVDLGVPSHLGRVARQHHGARCIVVEGRYGHVSFLLNADPLVVRVVDVAPPEPAKLADQVSRVLDVAEDLPPLVACEHIIDSRSLVTPADPALAGGLVVPCRGGGIEISDVDVTYLDERPATAAAVLLGCERSQQIHRWFYGTDPAEVIDWCPRRIIEAAPIPSEPGAPATHTAAAG